MRKFVAAVFLRGGGLSGYATGINPTDFAKQSSQ